MDKNLVIETLVEKLLEAKKAYYTNTQIMTDALFDEMEDDLRKLDPNNKYFSIVGTNVKGSLNIKHRIPMLSCGKSKTVDGLINDWMRRINLDSDFIAMPKVDGLSASIEYVNGKLSCISTRGDGEIGQDITWLRDYLNIPKVLYTDYKPCEWQEIRGEIYIPKDTKLETNGKPLRNIASGLVNRKDDKTNCEYLKFVAYQYYDSEKSDNTFEEDLRYLRDLGFDIVDYKNKVTEFDLNSIRDQYLSKWRSEWLYETDGLVFQYNDKSMYEEIDSHYTVDHHSFFRWALKPPSESAETKLLGITWDVSRNGNVIPVAFFEPVHLGNKEIKNATLNNYENVEKLDLHVGDTVEIANSNEVIPFFVRKVNDNKFGDPLFVRNCPCCGETLIRNGVHIRCTNPECPEQAIKSITYYCTKAGMDSVSESTIRALFDWTFIYDYIDLYHLKDCDRELIKDIDGFGDSKIDNLLFQIEKSKDCTIVEFLDRLGIELVGEKALAKLGIKTVDDFWKFNDTQYVIGQNLIEYRTKNKKGIEELLTQMNIKEEKMIDTDGSYHGSVCMTGADPWKLGRKELEHRIKDMGYESVDSVSKTTSILVVDDLSSTSSKMAKAQKLGIKILKYEEFFK